MQFPKIFIILQNSKTTTFIANKNGHFGKKIGADICIFLVGGQKL